MDTTRIDPEQGLERTGDELEERLEHLESDLDAAREAAHDREVEADPLAELAGDWEEVDDADDEDADGFDDPEDEESLEDDEYDED